MTRRMKMRMRMKTSIASNIVEVRRNKEQRHQLVGKHWLLQSTMAVVCCY